MTWRNPRRVLKKSLILTGQGLPLSSSNDREYKPAHPNIAGCACGFARVFLVSKHASPLISDFRGYLFHRDFELTLHWSTLVLLELHTDA